MNDTTSTMMTNTKNTTHVVVAPVVAHVVATAASTSATTTTSATATTPKLPRQTPPPPARQPPSAKQLQLNNNHNNKYYYYSIIIDSGPIIKNEIENLIGKSIKYVTTPTVISEIRDASSRQYLNKLMLNPNLNLQIRQPTEKSIQSMISFSKQTGDYASLSKIDLHVLALTLDMEIEGCCSSSLGLSSSTTTSTLLDHIRTTPKRKIGLGSILPMNNSNSKDKDTSTSILEEEKRGDEDTTTNTTNTNTTTTTTAPQKLLGKEDYDEVVHEDDDDDDDDDDEDAAAAAAAAAPLPAPRPIVKSSWANLANPTVDVVAVDNVAVAVDATAPVEETTAPVEETAATSATSATATSATKLFASMEMKPSPFTTASKGRISSSAFAIVPPPYTKDKYGNELELELKVPIDKVDDDDDNDDEDVNGVGQFDDASESEEEEEETIELELEFPSLLAASTVPYEGEDNEINNNLEVVNEEKEKVVEKEEKGANKDEEKNKKKTVFLTDEEKAQNLSRVSKSGRSYNSFRKYKGLMKPKQQSKKKIDNIDLKVEEETTMSTSFGTAASTNTMHNSLGLSSKIIGGGGMGGETMFEKDDDGTGWITSTQDIKLIKNESGGRLDPGKCLPTVSGGADTDNAVTDGAVADGAVATSGSAEDGGIIEGGAATVVTAPANNSNSTTTTNSNSNSNRAPQGPPLSQRSACVTTDFAMQNVLLQMNLHLLSTDNGMRIKRLKSWVIRCGACFKIHGADDEFKDDSHHYMKRLFCSHCGSGDMMQRISASVDGKTGRLKLHFSKRKQGRIHSIRGTKFSLPKSGVGKHNRFKGDLLLREDQLLSGVWNQKVKINSGNKYQTSKSHSIFGRDIASSVGCNVKSTSSAKFGGKGWSGSGSGSGIGNSVSTDDIKVGFGARKNPNAAKGRERRGKKKTSHDRACGMRRY